MEVRSVEAIVTALNGARVKYLIVGGLAVIAHGYERLTKDVDLVIALEPGNIRRGLHALLKIGYSISIPVTPDQFADSALREKWRAEKQMVVLKLWSDEHRRTPIDVFIYEPFDFEEEYRKAVLHAVLPTENAPIGARKHVHLLGLQSTFREKLAWLEEAESLALRMRIALPPKLRGEESGFERKANQTA